MKNKFFKISFYRLYPPAFSKNDIDIIYRYCYLMGYHFEIENSFYLINKGMGCKIYNEDKSKFAYLQSNKYSNDIYAIYHISITNINDCLFCIILCV